MSNLIDWLIENEPAFRKNRLPSLYSDLAVQKSTNPEGYAANVSAWQSAVCRAGAAGRLPSDQKLVLQVSDDLLNALANPSYGRPSGLGLVLDEGIRDGQMVDLKPFLNADTSIYHKSWLPNPWTVLRWGLKQTGLVDVGSYDMSGRLRKGQLVLVPALEDLYKQIMAEQEKRGRSITDRIMTRDAFVDNLNQSSTRPLSDLDVTVLLRYLERDKQVLSYDAKTVKFKADSDLALEPLTQQDATIASLKSLIANLELQVSRLNSRIADLQSNAQLAIKNKNRTSALSALRSKKSAEKSLQHRIDTLQQLEEVFGKIEQAVDQVQTLEAMQASAGVLRSLNQRVGGVDRVEDIVEDLREQMDQVSEVGQVLQEPLDGRVVVDDAEVDEEFEAMEQAEERSREEKEAEANRKKLEELQRFEEASFRKAIDADSQAEDSGLEKSMKRLSVEDEAQKKAGTEKEPEVLLEGTR